MTQHKAKYPLSPMSKGTGDFLHSAASEMEVA